MQARTSRTDACWLRDLQSDGQAARDAHADLRGLLHAGLTRALAGRGVDAASIDDFTQEAALRVLDRLGTYRGESRFTTWATAIAVRVAFTHLRRRRAGTLSLDQLEAAGALDHLQPEADDPPPAQRAARRTVLELMRRVIDGQLTDRQRRVLLAELAGMPKEQLADELGLNTNALYKATHDARKRLRVEMEQRGVSAEAFAEAFG